MSKNSVSVSIAHVKHVDKVLDFFSSEVFSLIWLLSSFNTAFVKHVDKVLNFFSSEVFSLMYLISSFGIAHHLCTFST